MVRQDYGVAAHGSGLPGISGREAEVLGAIGERLTNAEIAARLSISVRTVESHVSSLLRKLQVADRLALVAAARRRAAQLPEALTPFVGRVAERVALAEALKEHRLVTVVGPGGVGKTRLALSVAAELADGFANGVRYVDLVPVGDPAMVAATIADALGLGERPGSIVDWLGERELLLVVDNCEHVADGVGLVLERLLLRCRRVSVLATSRARLLAPYEWVFPVQGLTTGDAVELFLGRIRAAGGGPVDGDRVAAVCRELDGVALAVELAAARFPSLGLDGLEAGLADPLRLLTGGPRVDTRHRSLRSTLDWSYALLTEAERVVLRRVAVFAGPFTAAAAGEVVGGAAADALAGLVDRSLLVAVPGAETRYRALETIRQYGLERLAEVDEVRARHLRWCLTGRAGLAEMRAALAAAAGPDAYELALRLAERCFAEGRPGEAQRRYEQAAAAAPDDRAAAEAWRNAAGAAQARHFGDDSLRLRRRAADAALRAGDRAGAAVDLARNGELIHRARGLLATEPPPGAAAALLDEAWTLAGDDPTAHARLRLAEAFVGGAELPERLDDPLMESAALDRVTVLHLARGDVEEAARTARRRVDQLAGVPITARDAFEFFDAYVMAADSAVAAGDLTGARELAERLRDLPYYREEGHLATARLLVVTVLAGDWDEAAGLAERFREGWERAGRPRTGNIGTGAYAAATLCGLRGDHAGRADWLAIADRMETPGRSRTEIHFGEFFDALLFLHQGRPEEALRVLATPPEQLNEWYSGLWRPWYAALWAEAAVLCGQYGRLDRARLATRGNPIATAIVERAAARAH